eukprot:scaffold44697_cov18-Tisochrysis_lutea.AAC.3
MDGVHADGTLWRADTGKVCKISKKVYSYLSRVHASKHHDVSTSYEANKEDDSSLFFVERKQHECKCNQNQEILTW